MKTFGIVIFILIFFIFIFFIVSSFPKRKGKRGEKIVARMLSKFDGMLFNDYMMVDENKKSHQMDHILVCSKGVIIVETKNYSGRIYGNELQTQWTQVLKYGKVKHKLYNPIKQNNSHLYQIGKITKKRYPLISIVIFVQGNTSFIQSKQVFSPRSAFHYIQCLPNLLSEEDINCVSNLLIENENKTITLQQHVQGIRETRLNIEKNICPRCGKPLILREGKNGSFYGCSGFPYCKFTKKC